MRRLELKDFSVCQFANPGMLHSMSLDSVSCSEVLILKLKSLFVAALQRHYAMLQAIALDENDIRETRDETLPDEEGMKRLQQSLLFISQK